MEKKKVIKNVVFDLGNVLVSFNREEIISKFTADADEGKYLFEKCFLSPEWVKLDLGEISAREAAAAIVGREGGRYRELTERFFAEWYKKDLPDAAAFALARKVRSLGFGVYVLSNMQSAAADYFISEGLFRGFDGVVISAFEHIKKPDPRIFRVLLDRYKLKAGECLFIDDDDTGASYKTANALGFSGRAVRPNDVGDVEAALKEHGIL